MQRSILYILSILVVGALVLYTVTFTVKFNQAAVVTTFGRAGDGSIVKEAGLKWKWPYPVQSVTSYDTTQRFTSVRLETQQTADSRQIIVEGYCVWRVDDPLKFFQRFLSAGPRAEDHFRSADDTVKSNLRSAMGAVSRFRMDQLFTTDQVGSKLPELEGVILESLKSGSTQGAKAENLAGMGIEVLQVGISQVVLPQDTTQKVFDRMIANRDGIANRIRAQGEAQASAIRSSAEQDAGRIEAFAKARAQEIRQLGDREALQFYEQMGQHPELAEFLKKIEFLREAVGRKGTTLVLPTNLPGLELLRLDNMDKLKSGALPTSGPDRVPAGKESTR